MLRTLAFAIALLLLLHLFVVFAYIIDWRLPGIERFYFDSEGNVPTWFGSALLLAAALVLAVIEAVKRGVRDPYCRHWLLLALLFLALSIDEAASFHEVLIKPMVSIFNLSGFFRFGWVVVGGLFVAAVLAYYLRFLGSLPARTRMLFLLAGGVYVIGVLGMEMVGGYFFLEGAAATGMSLVPYMVAMTMEETLEMAGVLLFIYALLDYLRSSAPFIELRLR
ncbi:hypothetical protein WG922_05605 [Ramlibacter sp. AN1015]|uniref:hypothetical protein n=1 Tax=Ramlibacter sp. AN1015 TaxID=3133428 RepID=UPI0030C1E2A8